MLNNGAVVSFTTADLVAALELEQIEENIYRGRSPDVGWQRVFGGLVISQALVAASRTVDGRTPHSLHGYFLLPGDPAAPIIYEVDRLRDGRSFTTRRCTAIQHGRPIFMLAGSFQVEEPGLEHALEMPDVPAPDALPDEAELIQRLGSRLPPGVRAYFERERPLELRPVDMARFDPAMQSLAPQQHIWMRIKHKLPDESAVHRAVLAYMSDMTLLDATLVTHKRSIFDPTLQVASLDHALWFHRAFRADAWLLYAQDSPSSQATRGLSRGLIFSEDGTLVASVAQEGLIRPRVSANA